MRKLVTVALAASLMIVAGSAFAQSPNYQRSFESLGSGAQEVPPVASLTTARINLGFNAYMGLLRYRLEVFRGEGVTMAHLHCAEAGVNGPIIATLFSGGPVDVNDHLVSGYITNDSITPQDGSDPACPTAINNVASLLKAVSAGLIYTNVHTEDNPPGEVRAQLFPGQVTP